MGADWPDYEGDSDSETGSETEVIVAGDSSSMNQSDLGGLVVQPSHLSNTLSSHWELEASAQPVYSPPSSNIPAAVDSQTAQKIMYLLDEIGTSNFVDHLPHSSMNFVHCDHCSGRLIVL